MLLRRILSLAFTFVAIVILLAYLVPALFDPRFPELPLLIAVGVAAYAVGFTIRPWIPGTSGPEKSPCPPCEWGERIRPLPPTLEPEGVELSLG